MTSQEIMSTLQSLGNDNIKKILLKHGVREPLFGVKVADLKPIQKKVKKDYALAKELYFTGNADAMYLAGLIADDDKMTKEDLQAWVNIAVSHNISEYTVPWVAAQGRYGYELAMQWINSTEEHIAAAGWATLSGLVALKPDNELNKPVLKSLLHRIEKNMHSGKNRERHTMNGFIMAAGTYVPDLTEYALTVAAKIGPVAIDLNGTACKVPDATEYIKKLTDKQLPVKKKKTIKC
jgi:3-methyladenine DNA glycosylase AlkD